MELKFKTSEVMRSISIAASVVGVKSSLPILSDLLLEVVNENSLKVIASDGEVWLQLKAPIVGTDCVGTKVCVLTTDFVKALKNLGDVEVTLNIDIDKQIITCNYGNGHFTLPFDNPQEYPMPQISMDGAYTYIVDGKKVLKAIEKTGFAVANDELRPVMNGIRFDFSNKAMTTASTDGHKLAKSCDTTITHDNEEVYGFTMPAKTANVSKNILSDIEGDIKITFTDKAIEINNQSFKLTARLVEGRYPNYEYVIPKDYKVCVDIDKIFFINALKRVLPMGNATSELVALTFSNGNVTISAEDIDFSKSACETIKCNYEGEDMTIGFKGSALLQILTNLDGDNVVMELTEPNRATVIYDLNKDVYLSLIMPMLVQ